MITLTNDEVGWIPDLRRNPLGRRGFPETSHSAPMNGTCRLRPAAIPPRHVARVAVVKPGDARNAANIALKDTAIARCMSRALRYRSHMYPVDDPGVDITCRTGHQ